MKPVAERPFLQDRDLLPSPAADRTGFAARRRADH